MSTDLAHHVTAEDYLARERSEPAFRSEWVDGEIREMVGAKFPHNTIAGNIVALLSARLWDEPLVPLPGDMKIRIPGGPYYYPDVCVVPDPPECEDAHEDVVLNPLVVVEVLSPSTESFDRGRKRDDYHTIPSLVDFLIIDQFEARVDHHWRDARTWNTRVLTGLDATVSLTAFHVELSLVDVYHRILSREE